MEHHHDMASLGCNGQPLGHEYGSHIGHVAPGALFIIWGVWHMLNICWSYAFTTTHDGHDKRFRSHAAYRLQLPGGRSVPVESVLKTFGPIIGLCMELWTGGSYQALICEKNTAHPGWFHGENINNWQHAVLYPPIMLSGLVDLSAPAVPLPPGTPHAFLTLVFLFEGLIMGSHTKPVPLDNVVHQYLALTSLTLALVTLVETCYNRHVLIAVVRSGLMVLQGTWLCAIARIMFEGRVAWDTHIMAPHDYIPVLYCWHILFIAAGFIGIYSFVAMWQAYLSPKLFVAYSPLSASQPADTNAHGLPVSTNGRSVAADEGDLKGHARPAGRSRAPGASHHRSASGSCSSSDIELSVEVVVPDHHHNGHEQQYRERRLLQPPQHAFTSAPITH